MGRTDHDGLRDEAALCGATVVGGDVVRSDVLTVAVTALGDLGGRAPVTGRALTGGDIVGVAGRLGWAAAGLRLLRAGVQRARCRMRCGGRSRPDLGPALARLGVTSMVDVSDGLVADLGHVAAASGVHIELSLDRCARSAPDGVTDDEVLTGGDDHALAFTIPPDAVLPRSVTW